MATYKFIKDLKLGTDHINIELKIDFFTDINRGQSGLRYCHAILIDENGDEIKTTFFGHDVDKLKKAKKVKITNGYIGEYNGQLQLRTDRDHPVKFS